VLPARGSGPYPKERKALANNELVFRAFRDALDSDNALCDLLEDVDAAIESYAASASEEPETVVGIPGEMQEALPYAESIVRTVDTWRRL
jgi:hypothetical protein